MGNVSTRPWPSKLRDCSDSVPLSSGVCVHPLRPLALCNFVFAPVELSREMGWQRIRMIGVVSMLTSGYWDVWPCICFALSIIVSKCCACFSKHVFRQLQLQTGHSEVLRLLRWLHPIEVRACANEKSTRVIFQRTYERERVMCFC